MAASATASDPLTDEERIQLATDLPAYAECCLSIRTKTAEIQPLVLNRAQTYLHERLEAQREATGQVRAIILKGRQQGCSSYVAARFYQQATHRNGVRVFILTHAQDATDNLFGIVERFHQHLPEMVKPHTGAANAKELNFDLLDSGYRVGTAGAKDTGRSQTLQLLHGCLSPMTPIVDGATGTLREMGAFAVGDSVRTHTGAVAAVSAVSRQRKPALSVRLKGLSRFPLVATAEHRFWTPSGWAEMSTLDAGDTIGFPVAAISDVGITWSFRLPPSPRPQGGGAMEIGPGTVAPSYDLGWLLGRYLADGCILKQSSNGKPSAVCFAVHERKTARMVKALEAMPGLFRSARVATREGSKTVTVTAYGGSFAAFALARCGELGSKALPPEWASCGPEFVRGLVHGYLSGDGHSSIFPNDRRISATSIRSAITVGMRDALASLGYGWACIDHKEAAIRHGRDEQEAWILRLCGAGVDRLTAELDWDMPPRQRPGHGSVDVRDGFAWLPIEEIVPAGEADVMDFEVDHPDHSYCTIHGATHNSEVAFWPRADTHAAGALQAVPDAEGTEVIFESTANGVGNLFHGWWQDATKGKSEYIPIFIPWFWQDEYRKAIPDRFKLDDAEREYQAAYGLTLEQMAWRRAKVIELKGEALFKQEYPATPDEAFDVEAEASFIPGAVVRAARQAKVEISATAPLVIGVDPARFGDDHTAIIRRRGRCAFGLERHHKLDTMQVAGLCAALIRAEKPRKMFIDVGGLGAGVVDRLLELKFGAVVEAVNFGSRPVIEIEDHGGAINRRAEMWSEMRDWLDAGITEAPVQIPDDDSLHADLTAPRYTYDSNQRVKLETKEHMRARGVASPNDADALCLTFAAPIHETYRTPEPKWLREARRERRAGFMAG